MELKEKIQEKLTFLSPEDKKTVEYYFKALEDESNLKKKFGVDEIYQIFLGMKENLPYKDYAKLCYNSHQMNQLRQGIIECKLFAKDIEEEKFKKPMETMYKLFETPDYNSKLMLLCRSCIYIKYKSLYDFKEKKDSIFSKDEVFFAKDIIDIFKKVKNYKLEIKKLVDENHYLNFRPSEENQEKILLNNEKLKNLRSEKDLEIKGILTGISLENFEKHLLPKVLDDSKIFRKKFYLENKNKLKNKEIEQ